MKNITQRLNNLEAVVKLREAERKSKEPFVEFRIWSLMLNEGYLIEYPEGRQTQPKSQKMSLDNLEEWRQNHPQSKIVVSMGYCSEWLHMVHQDPDKYTEEQLQRFKAKDIKTKPEIALLYQEPEEIRERIRQYPQQWTLKREEQ